MIEETYNNNYTTNIPSVLHATDITDSCKILMSHIFAYSSTTGICTARNKKLAKLTNCSVSAITKRLSLLEKQGYITVVVSRIVDKGTEREIIIRLTKGDMDKCGKVLNTRAREVLSSQMRDGISNVIPKGIIENADTGLLPEKDITFIQPILAVWGKTYIDGDKEKLCGSQHHLPKEGNLPTKTITNIIQYTKECTDSILSFYDKHISELSDSWLKAKGITREKILKNKKSLQEIINIHLETIKNNKGATKEVYFDHSKVSRSLQDFYIQRSNNVGSTATVVSSWLLFWICYEDTVEERKAVKLIEKPPLPKLFADLEHKFHMYEGMYKKFEKLFGESDDTTLLTEAYIITLKAVEEVSESNYIKPIEAFNTVFKPMVEAIHWMDNLNPKAFMPNRKMWVDFIHKYKDSNSFVKNAVNKYIRLSGNDIEEIK